MKKPNLGFAMCASFCTIENAILQAKKLTENYNILPILSENLIKNNTRFGEGIKIKEKIEKISKNKAIISIIESEPIGPQSMTDIMLIAPCTGNSLAKISRAITDTCVTMATKSHLRVQKPLVICLATNDALGASFENISKALNTKHIFFVPMKQDSPNLKPNSLVADFEMIPKALELAASNIQIQPIFK
ncbi:MAG: dipicolinate synthase subunit B [Oscillospiraceae bacterium]|jgi:dipicolinate synthase subunit B|nr:dipicolinate synthase subunit B [Oscillospiraceae bacterium]